MKGPIKKQNIRSALMSETNTVGSLDRQAALIDIPVKSVNRFETLFWMANGDKTYVSWKFHKRAHQQNGIMKEF